MYSDVFSICLGTNLCGESLHLKMVNEVNRASLDKGGVSFTCFSHDFIPCDFKVVFSLVLLACDTSPATS